jgi:ribonuclease BN (tRNA processing enzyme)
MTHFNGLYFLTHAHGDHILDVEAIAKEQCNNCFNAEIAGYYGKAFNRIHESRRKLEF